MTTAQWLLAAFWGVSACLVLLWVLWRTWTHLSNYAARRIETMIRDGLTAPPRGHHDIDAEYRALVAAEQKRD